MTIPEMIAAESLRVSTLQMLRNKYEALIYSDNSSLKEIEKIREQIIKISPDFFKL